MQINNFWNRYTYNIKRTHRHKVAYTIDEYKQFGYNTIDSITHDADKMFLYFLGVPHDKVVKIHRRISEHHIENGIKKNIKSMFIDMHCSGDKNDKVIPFKQYFYSNPELKLVPGFEQFSKDRNFGENVPITNLKEEVNNATASVYNFIKFGIDTLKRMRKRK